jgi:hypothetical protein
MSAEASSSTTRRSIAHGHRGPDGGQCRETDTAATRRPCSCVHGVRVSAPDVMAVASCSATWGGQPHPKGQRRFPLVLVLKFPERRAPRPGYARPPHHRRGHRAWPGHRGGSPSGGGARSQTLLSSSEAGARRPLDGRGVIDVMTAGLRAAGIPRALLRGRLRLGVQRSGHQPRTASARPVRLGVSPNCA